LDRHLSRRDAVATLEIIHASLDCQDSLGLCALVQSVAGLIDAEFGSCLINSKDPETGAERMVIVDAGFPTGWLEHYASREFHLVDPIIQENFTNFGLQYWADTYAKMPPPRRFLLEAADAGLDTGFSYGLQDATGTGGSLFSFGGPKLPRHPRSAAILELVLPHLHRVLNQLNMAETLRGLPPPLSPRELEVLKWIGAGKSSWETGMILKIAERTVNFHIRNIMLKLDAVNRPQAVATALKLGLLQLP
jgi:DNA-binding CsgD family transcriptional regulator